MCIIIIIIIIIILTIFLLFKDTLFKKESFKNYNIPKVIYLTYKTKDIPTSVIDKFKEVYSDYEIKIYDNYDCIEFLNKEFGQEYVDIFNYIKDGPIKADFWRICILYKYGGIYSDIDIIPIVNIQKILLPDTTFLTCVSASNNNINPHFIVSESNHFLLKKCIDKYLQFYKEKKYSYDGWSIVYIMKDVMYKIFNKYINTDGIYYDNENNKYQFLKEVFKLKISDLNPIKLYDKIISNFGRDLYCKYNNIIVLYNKNEIYSNHKFK